MNKNLIFLLMFVAQNIMADVTVQIDGIDNATVKAKMERIMSAFLTEVNNAQSSKRALNFGGMGLSTNVQSSVSMLWENSPFECTDEEIMEHCIQTGSGYQVRNIPLIMRPTDSSFNEDEYQEAVFSFDLSGNLESFYLTLSMNLYMNVIKSNKSVTDLRRRQLILDYVEHFRTAYNQKDKEFLEAVFSDDALIITGKVIPQRVRDNIQLPARVEYTRQTKRQYMTKLSQIFAANKHIKVTFDEIRVVMHPTKSEWYGVTLHQGWTSDRYHDDGWLFLLWDFSNEDHPTIHVRTWQPDKIEGKKLPDEEIFSLDDFNIVD
ncbi:nuclear transport factor 2 family protein [Prevotella loescheii]|nr:nuclear transport factor 2 family protein [Hoylesella loescheii]